MVKDSTHIYISEAVDNLYGWHYISRVNIITGEIEVLTMGKANSSYSGVYSIVVDDTNVYWLIGGNHYYPPMGQLRKCAKSY